MFDVLKEFETYKTTQKGPKNLHNKKLNYGSNKLQIHPVQWRVGKIALF